MRFLQKTYQSLIILLLALSGCVDEASIGMEVPVDPDVPTSRVFITLNIPAPAQTRNTPAGDEDGDGVTEDETAESKVNNITVYFYQKEEGQTLTDAALAGKRILAATYFSALSQTSAGDSYTTETKEVELKDGKYQILVVANAANMLSRVPVRSPLSDLCGYTLKDLPYRENTDGSYSNFVMTSAEEQTVTLEAGKTEEDHPLTINGIRLQRLAARIDFLPTLESDGTIKSYTVEGGKLPLVSRFEYSIRPQAIKVVNRMMAGTYLLKRTAVSIENGPDTYLGEEKTDAEGVPVNYVVDPWSSGKTPENYGDNYHYEALYEERAGETHVWEETDRIRTTGLSTYPDGNKEPFHTLCYALENTTSSENQLCGYSTGIIIKATVIPSRIVGDGSIIENTEVKDFWYCNGIAYATKGLAELASLVNRQEVVHYKDGIAYYPYFIRHCYNDTPSNAVMEFAIVRNNVYKLSINSINSMGNPEDTIYPDTPAKETLVKIGAAVRPWNELEKEDIIM